MRLGPMGFSAFQRIQAIPLFTTKSSHRPEKLILASASLSSLNASKMNATAADYWVHNLSPFLLRFPESWPLIGGAGIRYYGLAYILGAVAGYYLLLQYYRKGRSPFNSDQLSVLILALMAGVLIGGRVGYVLFYGLQDFFHNPLSIFAVWQGGMASHGGFIGVAIAVILFSKKHKYPTLATGDLVVSAAPPEKAGSIPVALSLVIALWALIGALALVTVPRAARPAAGLTGAAGAAAAEPAA